ncbi:MAG: hypothetical protein MHM6MM_006375 [Cercozoa sp. M6MM]
MQAICGDLTGLVKVYDCDDQKIVATVACEQRRENGVTAMCFLNSASAEEDLETDIVVVARRDGRIDAVDLDRENVVPGAEQRVFAKEAKNPLADFDWTHDGVSALSNLRIVASSNDGALSVLKADLDAMRSADAVDSVWQVLHEAPALTFGASVTCVATRHDAIALAGTENILTVYDATRLDQAASKKKRSGETWRAKNVRNDELDLRQKIAPADICFAGQGTDKVVEVTRTGEVRLYDVRQQKRPVQRSPKRMEHALTRVVADKEAHFAFVADNRRLIHKVDLRQNAKVVATYKGSAGASQCLTLDSDEVCVASVGLDRHLRMWQLENAKTPTHSVFMRQQLGAVLLRDGIGALLD